MPTTRAISRRCASGKSRVLFGNDFEGSFLRFVEQIGELHCLAAARFERLAVLAENRAEPDVGQFRFESQSSRLPFSKCGEDLQEMQLLSPVSDVNDFIGFPGF